MIHSIRNYAEPNIIFCQKCKFFIINDDHISTVELGDKELFGHPKIVS